MKLKGTYVSELTPETTVLAFFVLSQKDVRKKKNGDPYLSMVLSDKTGSIDARAWELAETKAKSGDFVKVAGTVSSWQGKNQINVTNIRVAEPKEIDVDDFLPTSLKDNDEMMNELVKLLGDKLAPNGYLVELAWKFLDDDEVCQGFRTAPAAKGKHHAYIGGLLEHTLALIKLAVVIAPKYSVNEPLLIAICFLHDIGKTRELEYSTSIGYSREGTMIGHIPIGYEMVSKKISEIRDFPTDLRERLLHGILSHHGLREWGSPVVPSTREAILFHLLDMVDSRMQALDNELAAGGEGDFTGFSNTFGTFLRRDEEHG